MTFDEAHEIILHDERWSRFFHPMIDLLLKNPLGRVNILDVVKASGLDPFTVRRFIDAGKTKRVLIADAHSVGFDVDYIEAMWG